MGMYNQTIMTFHLDERKMNKEDMGYEINTLIIKHKYKKMIKKISSTLSIHITQLTEDQYHGQMGHIISIMCNKNILVKEQEAILQKVVNMLSKYFYNEEDGDVYPAVCTIYNEWSGTKLKKFKVKK